MHAPGLLHGSFIRSTTRPQCRNVAHCCLPADDLQLAFPLPRANVLLFSPLSTLVLQAFDELLLLRRGGDTVFQGKIGVDSSDLIQYFSSIRWDSYSLAIFH